MPHRASKKSFKKGEIIIRQGEPGGCAYIIENGRVEVLVQNTEGQEQILSTRGAGTMIGEMAIVDNAPRTATVRALEDCTMLEISKDDFTRRLNSADPVLKMTAQVILTRYRDTLLRADIRGETKNWPPVEALELNYAEQSDVVETIKTANEFQEALYTKQLSLNYQPIIALGSQDVLGFEALMRWSHPVRGFIPPNVFIPVAEKTGLIIEASKWALRESCSALKRIKMRTRQSDLFMSVNFSSTDFAAADFVDTLYNIVSETDTDMKDIHLEITERLLMDQPENARETLKQCRKAGMGISIDDFGTGYSSLSYLHYFPINTLKIDRSFVSEMLKDESSLALIKSIISLGKNMKMHVIAEGVEHMEEGEELLKLGCDMAQGYHYAKPMAEGDLIEFMNKNRQ